MERGRTEGVLCRISELDGGSFVAMVVCLDAVAGGCEVVLAGSPSSEPCVIVVDVSTVDHPVRVCHETVLNLKSVAWESRRACIRLYPRRV